MGGGRLQPLAWVGVTPWGWGQPGQSRRHRVTRPRIPGPRRSHPGERPQQGPAEAPQVPAKAADAAVAAGEGLHQRYLGETGARGAGDPGAGRRSRAFPPDQVFGCALAALCERERSSVPRFVQQCIRTVEARGTRRLKASLPDPMTETPGEGGVGEWGGEAPEWESDRELQPHPLQARGQRLPLPQGWTSTACTASVETWPPSRSFATRWTMVRPRPSPWGLKTTRGAEGLFRLLTPNTPNTCRR